MTNDYNHNIFIYLNDYKILYQQFVKFLTYVTSFDTYLNKSTNSLKLELLNEIALCILNTKYVNNDYFIEHRQNTIADQNSHCSQMEG